MQHRPEVQALLGEPVLEVLAALDPRLLEHPALDEALQPRREDVAGDAEVVLHLVEAADAEEDLAQDQHGPALADDLERASQRADLIVVCVLQHS